jgi:hypothetical protein
MTANDQRLVAEGLLGLTDIAQNVVPALRGRPCHPRSVQRWARVGLRTPVGVVKLESVMLPPPGGRASSRPAVERYFARLAEAQMGRRMPEADEVSV